MSSARVRVAAHVRALQLCFLTVLLALQSGTVPLWKREHAQLAAVAVRIGARDFSGRLGQGFPHVPRRRTTRAGEEHSSGAVVKVELLHEIATTSHEAAGIAWLLRGNPDAALEHLNAATIESPTPETWNDLAVTLLEICDKHQNLQRCVDAIAASDAAMARGADAAVALFNRAAALERLGLVVEARRDWLKSAAQSDSGWAAEARASAERLRGARAVPTSREAIEQALARGDDESLLRLLHADARLVRAYAESVYTTGWADAWLAQKRAGADRQLGYARVIGDALVKSYGERLLADSVAVIDEALRVDDQQRLADLARAYGVYRDGRRAHSRTEATKAADLFREAEVLFERARSPMELVARYYRGSAFFVQQKTAEAYAILAPLDETQPRQRGYVALEAQIGWELGMSLLLRGDYSAAIDRFEHSITLFLNLDDDESSGAIQEYRAEALQFMGEPEEAWNVRRGALEIASRFSNAERQVTALATTASSCLNRREWRRAAALLGIAIGIAERARHPVHASTSLIRRAQARVGLGEIDDAMHDLAEAQRWRRLIPDAGPAARLQADEQSVMARAIAASDPARAQALLTRSLEYYRAHELEVFVADALLAHGRTLRQIGDADSAREDLLDAITSVECRRRNVTDLQQRSMLVAAAEEIFAEAVDLAIDSGRTGEAFALAERSRGRALLDFLERAELRSSYAASEPGSPADVQNALAHDAAIVEMTALPTRLATFVVRADELRVVVTRTTPETLTRVAASCARASAEGDGTAAPRDCDAAAALFIRPIENALEGIRTIAVVPDRRIAGVPFAALPFRGGKLGSEVALI